MALNIFIVEELNLLLGIVMGSLERMSVPSGWACETYFQSLCLSPHRHALRYPQHRSPHLPTHTKNTEANNVARGDASRVHICPLNINEIDKYFKRDKFLT